MAKYMTREEFFHILLRQRQSNLTVKDFCANEGYNRSQFYDWRSRFNISDEELKSGSVPTAGMDGFVPISIDNNNVSALEKPRDFDPFGHAGFAHLWLQYD